MLPCLELLPYQLEPFRGCIVAPSLVVLCSLKYLYPVSHCSPARPGQHRDSQHHQSSNDKDPYAVTRGVDLLDVHAEDGGRKIDREEYEGKHGDYKPD